MQNLSKLIFSTIIVIFLINIAGCSGGSSTTSSTTQYASISVPTTTYQDSVTASKFAVYTKAGNGVSTLTEIDTGSYFYVIESSYVGPDITMTSESITLTYDHGNVQRSGFIGYSNVDFLSESGSTIIGTSSQLPVVVVADGVISSDPAKNHAIMGMRVNNEVSVKLFLPYPYNQMFIFNAPNKQLIFGNFNSTQLSDFGTIQLPAIACTNGGVTTSAVANCWNDMAVPVNYDSTYQGVQTESMLNSLFDSGATSNFQYDPLPSWLMVNSSGQIENQIMASLNTNLGSFNIPLNQPTAGVVSNTNGGIVNVGNNIFNFYAVLFDQQNGRIGLNNVTNSDSVTVPLTYTLQGESMGLHMPINIGGNNIYVGVDTGSVGLRVLESSLTNKSDISITDISESYGYQDGVSITGKVAIAPVTIGGITANINFMLITHVDCTPSKPNCPKNSFTANGRAGLIGVRLDTGGSENGVWSPLPQLPGNYSTGFIIHGKTDNPSIKIGLTQENSSNFAMQKLSAVDQESNNIAPYYLWSVSLPATVTYPIGKGQTRSESGLVLYDTGTAQYTIYNVPTSESGTFASGELITQTQALSSTANFVWSFTTGQTLFVNSATKTDQSFPLVVNTGNIAFTLYDILYNVESGWMGFRQSN